MKGRLAAIALAIAFLAAPLPGVAAGAACSHPCSLAAASPCTSHAAPCASLTAPRHAMACCDAAPVAPESASKRKIEAPLVLLAIPAAHPCAPAPQPALSVPVAAHIAWLTSPLLFSVVLIV